MKSKINEIIDRLKEFQKHINILQIFFFDFEIFNTGGNDQRIIQIILKPKAKRIQTNYRCRSRNK